MSEARWAWSSQYNEEETRAGGYGWRYQALRSESITLRIPAGGDFEWDDDFSPINALIPPTLVAFRGRNQGYDGKDVTP